MGAIRIARKKADGLMRFSETHRTLSNHTRGTYRWMQVLVALIAIALAYSNTGLAQDAGGTMGTVGKPVSGRLEFKEYCAQCRGNDGTGNGPVAAELNRKPANLTLLSKNNRGVFPTNEVHDFIAGTKNVASHGTREMPVWGYAFMFRPGGLAGPFVPVLTPQEAEDKINRLVDYVRSIQEK